MDRRRRDDDLAEDAPGAAILRPRKRVRLPRVQFRAPTPARALTCARAGPSGHPCVARAEHWHHWIPQQELRRALFAGLDGAAARRMLARLLEDPRNLSAFCVDCHLSSEPGQPQWRQFRPFTADEVPGPAWEFADEWGLRPVLARLYRPHDL